MKDQLTEVVLSKEAKNFFAEQAISMFVVETETEAFLLLWYFGALWVIGFSLHAFRHTCLVLSLSAWKS